MGPFVGLWWLQPGSSRMLRRMLCAISHSLHQAQKIRHIVSSVFRFPLNVVYTIPPGPARGNM
jgi:hypothetical protein